MDIFIGEKILRGDGKPSPAYQGYTFFCPVKYWVHNWKISYGKKCGFATAILL